MAAVLFTAALIVEHMINREISVPVFIVAYLIVGFGVLKGAFENIREGDIFGEEFLMGIASLGAILIGQPAEAVAVMWLYCLGEFLQDIAVDRSRESITELMDIRPDHAYIIDEAGNEHKVGPDRVKPGDIIAVKPGEKIPLDGEVIDGESMLDTAALTGESVPRRVHAGDTVLSGCINTTGLIRIRVTKEYGDSTASRILELVGNAGERKSRSENFISGFAHVYTPVVCIAALALAVVPSLIFGEPLQWIGRALTFLVVSCPCALVISVPLSFFAGIGAASREGILVKGSNFLEALAAARIVVFDKTGTLTHGVFEVKNIILSKNASVTADELIELAAYTECNSTHPIASSIVKSYDGEIDKTRIASLTEMAEYGVSAVVSGRDVYAGNAAGLKARGINHGDVRETGTKVYVAVDGRYEGCILISDVIKEDAAEAVKGLRACGISKTVMFTGDNPEIAEYVARTTGMDEYRAGLLPADKVDEVERLIAGKQEKEKLVFVGDGVNDAPVLARADVGVAMGALGSDAAIEAADIVIMDDKPSRLVTAVKLSGRTLRIARQNIVFAIAVKVIVLVLSAFGVTNMWIAVFADVGVALLCVLSSLRNLRPVRS